jgi:hypothetical protein
MVSAEIQFTEDQMDGLRRLSARQGRSVEEIVREGIEQMLKEDYDARVRRLMAAAGRYNSGRSDISENHDAYLADDFPG